LRDQGRLLPKPGFLAQMSQTAATVHSDQFEESWEKARGDVSGQPRQTIRRPPAG
jgi:hypothetical protein